MSNFSSISVAPQIAAVNAIVTANGVILTDIHDTDLPDVGTDVIAVGVIAVDIHDIDLPAVNTIATANGVILTDLHDTDIPALLTAIGEVVNRGSLEFDGYNATPGDVNYHDALNYTGAGKLVMIAANAQATDGNVRVTIDGQGPATVTITTGNTYCLKGNDSFGALEMETGVAGEYEGIVYEFNSSILVECKQTNGANPMRCGVLWQKD